MLAAGVVRKLDQSILAAHVPAGVGLDGNDDDAVDDSFRFLGGAHGFSKEEQARREHLDLVCIVTDGQHRRLLTAREPAFGTMFGRAAEVDTRDLAFLDLGLDQLVQLRCVSIKFVDENPQGHDQSLPAER